MKKNMIVVLVLALALTSVGCNNNPTAPTTPVPTQVGVGCVACSQTTATATPTNVVVAETATSTTVVSSPTATETSTNVPALDTATATSTATPNTHTVTLTVTGLDDLSGTFKFSSWRNGVLVNDNIDATLDPITHMWTFTITSPPGPALAFEITNLNQHFKVIQSVVDSGGITTPYLCATWDNLSANYDWFPGSFMI